MKKITYILPVLLFVMMWSGCGDKPEEEVIVPALSVSPAQALNVAATGGNTTILVSTNQSEWNATSDMNWCKITDKTGNRFTITVDPNSSGTSRNAVVNVSSGKASPVKITVTQQGAEPLLSLSPAPGTVEFSAAAHNEKFTYTVTTNQSPWEMKVTPTETDWCKVTKDAVNNQFTIMADANEDPTPRSAVTVTVSAGNAASLQITVKQKGNTTQQSEDFGYGESEGWD